MGISVLHKKAPRWGAFFIAALLMDSAAALCPLPGESETVRIERVVDGDTLRLESGRRVRLIGVNTPELGGQGRAGEPYAQAARRFVVDRVSESGGRLRLLPGVERRDAHGRELAHLYDRQGRNLAALLLDEGLALQVAVAPNLRLVECHHQAESRARLAGKGVWRTSPAIAPAQLTHPGFALVRGRVARVARNRGGLWLELDGGLALRIRPQHQARFGALEPESLTGLTVEARGWVLERTRQAPGQARWLLELEHPVLLRRDADTGM